MNQDEPYNLSNDPASDMYPSWSPVTDRIAFQSDRDGRWQIYLMKPDGSELRNYLLRKLMRLYLPGPRWEANTVLVHAERELALIPG